MFSVATLFLLLLSVASQKTFHWQTYSKMHHFLKRTSSAIFTGGRLTSRQIGYVAQANFTSILSLAPIMEADSVFHGIEDDWPSSAEEETLAKSYGLIYTNTPSNYSVDSFLAFTALLSTFPKPVYVHCKDAYFATLYGLLYLVETGALYVEDIFAAGLDHGFDYMYDANALSLISSVTGYYTNVAPNSVPSIELPLTNNVSSYREYFYTHRMGGSDYWYNMGQPLENHVPVIQKNGFQVVVSFRANGETTNILSSDVKGEIENFEFSDGNGIYLVDKESQIFQASGIRFYNLPVSGSNSWSIDQYNSYVPVLNEISAMRVPTIVHCASGYRSSGYVLTYLAKSQAKCSDWVFNEARKIGLSFDLLSSDASVVSFVHEVLQC